MMKNLGNNSPYELISNFSYFLYHLFTNEIRKHLSSNNIEINPRHVLVRTTGGRNGLGAKLANVFSTEFNVTLVCDHVTFSQTWTDNMRVAEEPKIGSADIKDSTTISFSPDLVR
jgi:DNA topoisomerase-2